MFGLHVQHLQLQPLFNKASCHKTNCQLVSALISMKVSCFYAPVLLQTPDPKGSTGHLLDGPWKYRIKVA